MMVDGPLHSLLKTFVALSVLQLIRALDLGKPEKKKRRDRGLIPHEVPQDWEQVWESFKEV